MLLIVLMSKATPTIRTLVESHLKKKKTWREESTTGKKIVVTNNNGQYDLIKPETFDTILK
jgi:hypothetical protein